jgi:prevent-host-death family protein
MKSTYSISEAQSRLPGLVREVEATGSVTISRHGEPVAYLVSRDRMEAIVETLEILSDAKAMKAIADHGAGKTRFRPLAALDRDE